MVVVKVFFEGGADPRDKSNAATTDNTSKLRESFNKLLNSGFEEEQVRIQAKPAYSIFNFKKLIKNKEENSLFLMDLDGAKVEKSQRINDNQLTDIQEFVFFMIQRIEAWILSQPEVIEEVFAYYKSKSSFVKDDNLILDRDVENIAKPDKVLNIILQRYFKSKEKKLKYSKLKHPPDLIQNLDLQKLINSFDDVKRLVLKINEISSKS